MSIVQKFEAMADAWEKHCERVALSAKMSKAIECPEYAALVELGVEAVPLIVERQRRDDLGYPWNLVLQGIANAQQNAAPKVD